MKLAANDIVLVIGAARSGIAATKLLLSLNYKVILFDDNDISNLTYVNTDLNHINLTMIFNEKSYTIDDAIKLVIASPGVPLSHSLIMNALSRSIPVINEMDLAYAYLPKSTIIGVTGTNGKSSTTVMLAKICQAQGHNAIACGNLGKPLCEVVLDNVDIDIIILEISSFQLELLSKLKLDGAIITNITPDHLDRYDSFMAYKQAKMRIMSLLKAKAPLVLPDSLAKEFSQLHDNNIAYEYVSMDHIINGVNIIGLHNQENAKAAYVLARSLGIEDKVIYQGLSLFTPLPHRCETVMIKHGVIYVNDSKGTTVVSVTKALSMFKQPTHLLLGGFFKGEDFLALRQAYFPHIKGYYVFGAAQHKIIQDLQSDKALAYPKLAQAFLAAQKASKPGDVVLLSPGCASYDEFSNFVERGEKFRELVYAS